MSSLSALWRSLRKDDGGSWTRDARPGRRELAFLAGILVLSLAIRVYNLSAVPPGLFFDEGANGIDALNILQGEHPIFIEGNGGREPLFIYATAASIAVCGSNATAILFVCLAFGMATVVATYVMTRELFSGRVALLGTALIGFSYWHLTFSRLSFRAGSLPLFEIGAVYFLWRGVRRGGFGWYALAGLSLGASMYTYLASRATPIWIGLFGLLLFIPAWRTVVSAKRHFAGLVILVLVSVAIFAPLGRYYYTHPRQFMGRMATASLASANDAASTPTGYLDSTRRTLGMFIFEGDENARHNLPGRPVFDPILVAPFVLGLILALLRVTDPRYMLVLLWISVMLLPGALSLEAPHFLRTIGVLPTVFLLPAIGIDWAWRLAEARLGTAGRRAVAGLVALGLVASLGLTVRDYFGNWAPRADVYYSYSAESIAAAKLANGYVESGSLLIATTTYRRLPNPLAFFPGMLATNRYFDGSLGLLIPRGSERDAIYVYQSTASSGSGSCSAVSRGVPIQVVNDPAGRLAASAYRIAAGSEPASPPESPLIANLGRYLHLTGYDLDRVITPGLPVRLALHTELLSQLEEPGDWMLFAHLVRPDGTVVGSKYGETLTPISWQPGDRYIACLDLVTDRGLPAGAYRVEFGLFNAGDQRRQPISDGAGKEIGNVLVVQPLRNPGTSVERQANPQNLVSARLGDGITLLGYDLIANPDAPDQLRVRLYWSSDRRVVADYTVFVHVLDSAGKLVGQNDSQPMAGTLPTGVWLPGEVVTDDHELVVSGGASAARQKLEIGMYLLASGGRLPVTAGPSAGADSVTLDILTAR